MMDALIVSGASRGIGRNIAIRCSGIARSAIVIGSSKAIFELPGLLTQTVTTNVVPLQLDLVDYEKSLSTVQATIASLGEVLSIGAVLCASQIGQYGGLLESDIGLWDNLYRCNVLGNLAIVKACAQRIGAGARFRAVFFAGGGAAYAYPDFFGYSLTKVAVVRAVENLGVELSAKGFDASVIALAPGAVATDMLATVMAHGGFVKTKTDISEPTDFVRRFLCDEYDAAALNGRFLHVRDAIAKIDLAGRKDHFKLRRVE